MNVYAVSRRFEVEVPVWSSSIKMAKGQRQKIILRGLFYNIIPIKSQIMPLNTPLTNTIKMSKVRIGCGHKLRHKLSASLEFLLGLIIFKENRWTHTIFQINFK